MEKARTILESTDVDVNSLNTDGLVPLDVAVLSNNRSMTKMLIQHGAIEGTQCKFMFLIKLKKIIWFIFHCNRRRACKLYMIGWKLMRFFFVPSTNFSQRFW